MSEVQTKVITGTVRLSYAHIWEAQAAKGSTEKKYGSVLLIPKTDTITVEKIKTVIAALEAEVKAIAKNKGKLPKGFRNPLMDGDVDADLDKNPEYEGHYYINATSKTRPGVIDKNNLEIIDNEEIYSGVFCKASINFFAYDNVGVGVSAALNNLKKIKDGDKFGGNSSSAEEDFADDNDDLDEVDDANEFM